MEPNVSLTNHARNRLSKRLGVKTEGACIALAKNVISLGVGHKNNDGYHEYIYLGNTFIFIESLNTFDASRSMLMITACNNNKSSEWESYKNGKPIKTSTVKRSKIFGRTSRKKEERSYCTRFDQCA